MGKVTKEIFVPRNGRITIVQEEAPKTLGASGMLKIPEGQLQKPQRATLSAIDPDVKISAFFPGAKIIISKASGWEFLVNNKLVKMMHHNDIWGTIETVEVDEDEEELA